MSPFEDRGHSASAWAEATGFGYRSILDAIHRGELDAQNPSGRAGGKLVIRESAWEAWMEKSKAKKVVPGRVGRGARQRVSQRGRRSRGGHRDNDPDFRL